MQHVVRGYIALFLCFHKPRKEPLFKSGFIFTASAAVWVYMPAFGSVISDVCRVFSIILLHRSGFFWLILTATVVKHSATPTTTDVLTVFKGARPIHWFKELWCFSSDSNSLSKISCELYFQWYHFLRNNRICFGKAIDDPHVSTDGRQMCCGRGMQIDPKGFSMLLITELRMITGLWNLFTEQCPHPVADSGNNIQQSVSSKDTNEDDL